MSETDEMKYPSTSAGFRFKIIFMDDLIRARSKIKSKEVEKENEVNEFFVQSIDWAFMVGRVF